MKPQADMFWSEMTRRKNSIFGGFDPDDMTTLIG
jgi:hypothetical protein